MCVPAEIDRKVLTYKIRQYIQLLDFTERIDIKIIKLLQTQLQTGNNFQYNELIKVCVINQKS